jgi:hypothetical protein
MRGLVGLLSILVVGTVVVLGQPAPAEAGPKPKLGLLSIEAQDTGDARALQKSGALARVMTESLRARAADTGLYELPASGQKDLAELKLLSDCLDEKPECMALLGKDLDVEILVYGHISRKRDTYTLSLVALNVQTKKVVGQKTRTLAVAAATDDEIKRQAPQLFHETLGIPLETSLVVSSNAEGATVFVLGQPKGQIAGGTFTLRGVPEGKVLIAIDGNGWTRAEGRADLKLGVPARVELDTQKIAVAVPTKPPVAPPIVPPAANDQPSRPGGTYRALFWTSLVLTGAGATAFTITGLKVSSAEKDQEAAIMEWGNGYLANGLQHPNDACAEAENDGFQKLVDICDRGKKAATLSNVFLGVTAVGIVATGFFLWKGYLSPPKAQERGITVLPEIYPKGAGLTGTIQF